MNAIPAAKFQARCLEILDEIIASGEPVTILKNGRAVAQLVPSTPEAPRYPQHELFGTIVVRGDLLSPVLPPETWKAELGELT